ncbi:hypothetical protein KOAAANKH_00592 [Brevundimonas sp. NIBR10]|uniref:hypothetical protein n=1 Tax=Brevundimonas sp. NIBR10 TaxID=3015997 RepID=UPI0022F17BDF|nr:hypothetical protein [Brevundimonas sp. NIBR10]WGM45728.1 hypothetical protein KOAAANKH_00592 [Brevundimonas sp. NIBR10]
MLLLVIMLAGLSGQERAYSTRTEVYVPPVVRPYEPPSSFGRQIAEGDADASVRRRPITAPVAVEAYRNNYEGRRTPAELSYQQGVEAARLRQNARMGSLDGLWRVVDAEGRPVLDLVLSDDGAGPVEGALRPARSDRTALVEVVSAGDGARTVTAALGPDTLTLRLHPAGSGWTGELTGLGATRTVTLARPSGWAP